MGVEFIRELEVANRESWKTRVLERNLQDKKKGISRSLYYSLGVEIIDDGTRGLRRLSKWLWDRGEKREVYPGSASFKDLESCFPNTAQRYLDEYTKIWAGIVLKSSEEILCGNEDRVTGLTICTWHNAATDNTRISPIRPLDGIYPYVIAEERERLLEAQRKDETNVSLIGCETHRLPQLFKEYLGYTEVEPNMKSRIHPFAKRIANELKPIQQQHNRMVVATQLAKTNLQF